MTVCPPLLRIVFALLLGLLFVRPAAAELRCTESAGWIQARWYVDQCRLVVIASHAMCRPEFNCPLLQDEIRRGCAL
ncbi:MAG TPA: hypothetical protein VGF36_00335, partial [Rhodopila sp.]